jgi:hypothetical protein
MKDLLTGKMPLFPTQEKALKKIYQERARGDLAKARKTAVEALEKWPEDYDLAIEAAQACLELSDYPQAANILKIAHKRHASRRDEILELARAAFMQSFSTLLGSFIVETLLKARNIEALSDILRSSPESFTADLAKRGETRSKNLAAEGRTHRPSSPRTSCFSVSCTNRVSNARNRLCRSARRSRCCPPPRRPSAASSSSSSKSFPKTLP